MTLAYTIYKSIPDKPRKRILKMLPEKLRKKIKNAIKNEATIDLSDAIVISFPKCGRTWLRVLLAHVLQRHFDLKMNELLELHKFNDRDGRIPRIYFSHDDNPQRRSVAQLERNKEKYKNTKVVFLIRDPRDVLVSVYHHKAHRSQEFSGSISEYLMQPTGSIESIVEFYNIWHDNMKVAMDFATVRYENLHKNPLQELRSLLFFLGIPASDETIQYAISQSSFENMRKLELSGSIKNDKLMAPDIANPSSFKTRSGKVGGYTEHLARKDIEHINHVIETKLNPFYACYKAASKHPDAQRQLF